MAKRKKAAEPQAPIAGFTPDEWKRHMDTDEDWTERLDGATEDQVVAALDALGHSDANIRALACNLVYAIGASGLGTHAQDAVGRLATLAEQESKAKVRNRARIVHETLAGEVERATIRREFPWLGAFDEEALPQALAALDDARDAVRLQLYLWWANAATIPSEMAPKVAAKLAALAEGETDPVARRAAEIARDHVN